MNQLTLEDTCCFNGTSYPGIFELQHNIERLVSETKGLSRATIQSVANDLESILGQVLFAEISLFIHRKIYWKLRYAT